MVHILFECADGKDRSRYRSAVPMITVHLVRHGQSTWNVAKRLQGQTPHPPLTALGREQAQRAARHLADLVDTDECAIVTSDLVRARQTAVIIAAELSVSVTEAPSLREQYLGSLQGRFTHELSAEPVPEGAHISEVRWGGGESVADVHRRLHQFFHQVLPDAPSHLVLVTHGDTLRIARSVLTGESHRDVAWTEIPNGSVLTIPASRVLGSL